jgi:hypothetical protein
MLTQSVRANRHALALSAIRHRQGVKPEGFTPELSNRKCPAPVRIVKIAEPLI